MAQQRTGGRPNTAHRRRPRQERAQDTCDVIVQAAEKVIRSDGLDRCTTTRIAEVAGVSIGSVYQYFSSRDEIVARLAEQRFTSYLALAYEACGPLVAPLEPADVVQRTERLVDAFITRAMSEFELNRQIFGWMLTQQLAPHRRFNKQWEAALREALALLSFPVDGDPNLIAFNVINAAAGIALGLMLDGPAAPDTERMTRDVTNVVLSLLGLRAGVEAERT